MKHLGSSFLRESLSHISYARRQAQRRVRHASGLPILSAPRFNADLVRAHNYITRSPRGVKGELGELGQLLESFQTADSCRGIPFASGPSRFTASSARKKNSSLESPGPDRLCGDLDQIAFAVDHLRFVV